jgi:hypothetical protein
MEHARKRLNSEGVRKIVRVLFYRNCGVGSEGEFIDSEENMGSFHSYDYNRYNRMANHQNLRMHVAVRELILKRR